MPSSGQVQLICVKLDWPSLLFFNLIFLFGEGLAKMGGGHHFFSQKSPIGFPMSLSVKFGAIPSSGC